MSLLSLQESTIDPRKIISAYPWTPGRCFRCARPSRQTTQLDAITTPRGEQYEIRACRSCVIDLEDERRRHAERHGQRYAPGQLGRPTA